MKMSARKSGKWFAALAAVLTAGVGLGATQPAGAATRASAQPAVITQTILVGSGPNGVAISPMTGRIYVADGNDDTVSVINGRKDTVTSTINGRTDTVTGTIPVGLQPDAVAVSPRTGKIYVTNTNISDGSAGTVSVISGRTGTVTGTIPVGRGPAGVAVSPRTGKIYVTNYQDGTVSVIG